MFLPVVVYFFIFHYIPMYGVTLAFKDFNLSEGIMGSPWVGYKHFRDLTRTHSFTRALSNTVIISLLKLVAGFPAPIILALLLNEIRDIRFKKTVQTISYLPHFLSWIILSGIFIQFLSLDGFVNTLLGFFGIEPIYFMADNRWFRSILVITDVWKGVGWGTIVHLATIAGINPELYEAAECDGATRLYKMIHITLPMMGPTIAILLILNLGGILSAGFDQIFNMYNNAVMETADILDTYVYRTGLGSMRFSFATAVGLFKNGIGFFLVLMTNFISKKISGSGIW